MPAAFMTIEEARAKRRGIIAIGVAYPFFSDCVDCKTDGGDLIRNYSAQRVIVIGVLSIADIESDAQYKVRAPNGETFQANAGELNGWIFDTGQWVGPRVC